MTAAPGRVEARWRGTRQRRRHEPAAGRAQARAPGPGPCDRAPAGRHPGRRTDGQADEETQAAAQGPDRAAGVGPDPGRAGVEDASLDPGVIRSQASPTPARSEEHTSELPSLM